MALERPAGSRPLERLDEARLLPTDWVDVVLFFPIVATAFPSLADARLRVVVRPEAAEAFVLRIPFRKIAVGQ